MTRARWRMVGGILMATSASLVVSRMVGWTWWSIPLGLLFATLCYGVGDFVVRAWQEAGEDR